MSDYNRNCAALTRENFSWVGGQIKWERQIRKNGMVFFPKIKFPRVYWCNTRIFKKNEKKKKIIPSDKLVMKFWNSSKTVLSSLFATYLTTILSADYQTTFMFS